MKGYRKSAGIFAMALFALLVLAHRSPAAAPAAGQAPEPAKMEAGSGCECGHKHGGHGAPRMMEGMKKHMEEVRKTVAALREHEKKMEGIADPAEFRKTAIEHFRMLDDLQESHVKHMESMMAGRGHMHGHHESCKDCLGK